MFTLIITLQFFLLLSITIAGIWACFGFTFGKPALLITLLLSVIMSFWYVCFYHKEKSDFWAFLELLLMTILGSLVISVLVITIFRAIEGILSFTPYTIKNPLSWILMIVLISWLSIYAWRAAHATQLRTIQIPIDNLKKPSKILYLSDIHIARKSDLPFLHKLITMLNQTPADFIVINWDFIDGKGFEPSDIKILDTLNKPTIFTYGNHEAYAGNEYVYNLLKDTKLHILSDEKLQIGEWEILGLSDMFGFDTQKNRKILGKKLKENPRSSSWPKLLLLHEPIGPKVAEKHWANLQLAGHTHNGQLFPFTLFVKFAFPYIKGLYRFKTHALFVSSGAGTRGPPMRLGSRSEVVLLDLIPKN